MATGFLQQTLARFYPVISPFAGVMVLFVIALASDFALKTAIAAPGPQAERRVALVIGNSHYSKIESLANPVNDSRAMHEALTKVGFEVFAGEDLTLSEFNSLVDDFKRAAKDADTALVYYSGHGFQLRGQNYLVPSDAQLETPAAIDIETVRLDTLIADLQDPARQTLIFLDACRNNPLPPSRRTNDGLAQVEAGNGVFVAFATQPGNISYDGRSKLSPFTKAITNHLGTPNQSVSDMMILVRNDVERMTLHQQTPWDQSSLKRQFYFAGAPATIQDKVAAIGPASNELSSGQRSIDFGETMQTPLGESSENVLVLPNALGGAAPSNVILIPQAPLEIFGREDLIYAVQGELQRIGCYVGELDGVWSKGSREALTRYYATRKLRLQEAEPTEFHYDNLKREEGIICKLPKPAVPVVKQRAASKSPPRSSGRARNQAAAAPSRAAPQQPAAGQKTITNARVLGSFR